MKEKESEADAQQKEKNKNTDSETQDKCVTVDAKKIYQIWIIIEKLMIQK